MDIVYYDYNLEYELCSLIFLLCLSFQFFSSKKFRTPSYRIFTAIILVGIADIALDVTGCITLTMIDEIPLWINWIVNWLFYVMQAILPALMCTYVVYFLGMNYFEGNIRLIVIPSVIFLIILAIDPFTGVIFSLPEVNGQRYFAHGILFYYMYANTSFYLITVLVLVYLHKHKLTQRQIFTILLFVVLTTVAIVFQITHPNILMTGTAITVSIVLWNLTLQNPDNMLDEVSGAFDANGLKLYLEAEMDRGPVYAAVVEINGLNPSARDGGDSTPSVVTTQIGSFFANLDDRRPWFFRESKNRFWIFARTIDELNRFASSINERFNHTWDAHGFKIDLMAKILCVLTRTTMRVSPTELVAIINRTLDNQYMIDSRFTALAIDSPLIMQHRRRQIIEDSMRHAVKNNSGFHLCFQPIISLDRKAGNTAEVLLRYNDPDIGSVSPAEFIPIIEECGLAMHIDSIVIEAAAQFLARNPQVDLLHVNLSATEFFHNPVERISSLVNKYNVSPHRLCFEITETSAAGKPEMLKIFMNQMIDKGYEFALDDFGTGYSNTNQILNLPFKSVKIDKDLLSDSQRSQILLKYTISMLEALDIEPIVEGVETIAQLELVTSLGVRNVQGFLFASPLTEEKYLSYIKKA